MSLSTTSPPPASTIAVVIPSYKVTRHILAVIQAIGPEVDRIYVVDDCCPDGSGRYVQENNRDPRVSVLFNEVNLGVGGAVMAGYRAAIDDGFDIIVKIDGDGQMDPSLLPRFVAPIVSGRADYTKGNRFYNLEKISRMPKIRILGNAVLSFMAKFSSGYWSSFDPTNGYTAIAASTAAQLPLHKISRSYFFETDMLFRLNTVRAVVVDVPMDAKYETEFSNLKITQILGEFFAGHIRNFCKRIFYNYYLRGMSVASLELPLGLGLIGWGMGFGLYQWGKSLAMGMVTPAGTVMFSALPLILGVQLCLAFIAFDVAAEPTNSQRSTGALP
ncbi:glycosyltransferase involved in cell wall biosynthesis [Comamonas odontotermitis]|uniref:Glycosyltransferase involved in cell wall biosynthesis n=1 Tax=Comamonas odontotermitis TaxID=379895 RepID=A0ABR6RCS3_9BURK|nr:glycosyltransferase family 2 protein [Comamonas odontotermitis]MBB6576834.1 glycosyltransferase involved in cell wall biosynthesis [Comamonas odontotermitis]